jgi:cysteine desulfurase
VTDPAGPGEPPPGAYFDSASSEPLHPAAAEVLGSLLARGEYADPRRLHGPGRTSRLLLDNARAVTAEALAVRPDEVTFTSSGTDAVHRGLLGLVKGSRAGRTVVHSPVEHAAVLHAIAWGAVGSQTPRVDPSGRVPVADLRELAAADGVAAIALQTANHEVGTQQPVSELGRAVPVFTDACASMGRLPLPPGWDVAAGSAHKWGGPAGVGVLVVRKGTRWRQPFPGDDRADERAIGFENVPAALAAAAALQAVVEERTETNARQFALVQRIRAGVSRIPDTEVVGDPVDRLPHLVTFSFLYVDGEALVTELDRRGLGVASGSACAASTLEPSRVLSAMGVLTHGNVRVSLTRGTTEADVDRLLAALPEVVAELRARVGM